MFSDVPFVCNICGKNGVFREVHFRSPETPSCAGCSSNVRFRWLVHRLSIGLLGRSIPLVAFPANTSIRGLGLTDPPSIASVLAGRFSYVNTDFYGTPRLDIRCDPSPIGPLDFLIASEVFEHVEPPVSRAFENAARLLKQNGLLLLTVPWVWDGDTDSVIPELHDWLLEPDGDGFAIVNRTPEGLVERFGNMALDGSTGPSLGRTREHFPFLHDWRLSSGEFGERRLFNKRSDGTVESFHNLVFHGGEGLTLEMRLFTKRGIEDNLKAAGFDGIEFEMQDCVEFGIIFGYPWSRPLWARRRI